MEIIERMLLTLEKKNIKMSDLCCYLEINTSTMANWKTRKTDPPAKYIAPICEFLDISIEWLLTGKETNTPSTTATHSNPLSLNTPNELSTIENELMQNFRKLDSNTQQRIAGMLEGILLKDELSCTQDSAPSNLSSLMIGKNNTTEHKVG